MAKEAHIGDELWQMSDGWWLALLPHSKIVESICHLELGSYVFYCHSEFSLSILVSSVNITNSDLYFLFRMCLCDCAEGW